MSVNIKSLVEKLFHMSSSQAMPSTSEISVSASEGEGSFTAPTDGYLVLGASRKSSSDFAVVNIWNNINTCSASSAGYGQSRAYVPCKKGKTVQFSIIGNVDRSAFISTIGGGLSSILQSGGALCLRLKTILHQSATLLTKDPFLQTNLSTFSLRKQAKLMSRPLTVMLSVLSQISLMLNQSILATGNLLYRLLLATLMHGAVLGSLVKKGMLLQLISRVLGDRHFDLYSLGMVQANLAKEVCHG